MLLVPEDYFALVSRPAFVSLCNRENLREAFECPVSRSIRRIGSRSRKDAAAGIGDEQNETFSVPVRRNQRPGYGLTLRHAGPVRLSSRLLTNKLSPLMPKKFRSVPLRTAPEKVTPNTSSAICRRAFNAASSEKSSPSYRSVRLCSVTIELSHELSAASGSANPFPCEPVWRRIWSKIRNPLILTPVYSVVLVNTGGQCDGADSALHVDHSGLHPSIADTQLRDKKRKADSQGCKLAATGRAVQRVVADVTRMSNRHM
jgi:hypothetical protein